VIFREKDSSNGIKKTFLAKNSFVNEISYPQYLKGLKEELQKKDLAKVVKM